MHRSTTPIVMPPRERLDEAARRLEAGELVAFPTETVYGLGADAENPQAIAKIYAAKGRPSNHPVIVHVVDGADISYWADEVPGIALQLIEAFWPGPLTLILKRAPHIPAAVAGGRTASGCVVLRIRWRRRCSRASSADAAALPRRRPTSSAR